MPRADFQVYEDLTASFSIYTIPPDYDPNEPPLDQPYYIPRRPVPDYLNEILPTHRPGSPRNRGSTRFSVSPPPRQRRPRDPEAEPEAAAAALKNPLTSPDWKGTEWQPPWWNRDCMDKGRRDAEFRLTELRIGGGKGVEEELKMEEVELVMEEKDQKKERRRRKWRWLKKKLVWWK